VDLPRELGDLLGHVLVLTRQLRVGLEEVGQFVGLRLDRGDPLLREAHLFFMVLLGPLLDVLVPVGLAGLREQDQRRRVRGLEREREVEENEWVGIPAAGEGERIEDDPDDDDDRLADDVPRRAEEAGDALCAEA